MIDDTTLENIASLSTPRSFDPALAVAHYSRRKTLRQKFSVLDSKMPTASPMTRRSKHVRDCYHLPLLLEVTEVRRRLILSVWHQVAVSAQALVLVSARTSC
jgi:hypothetical protein